jgi:hypothetical protein
LGVYAKIAKLGFQKRGLKHMKIYRVLVRKQLFSGPGLLNALNVTFKSKTIALNFAKKKARELNKEKEPSYLIRVDELILKKLDQQTLLMAFDNEDIMDLVDQLNGVKIFKSL